ncbi:MAG: cell wall metabolism sensor histidine kinase WalK [candidate division Zixibacteria bacterium]|nr:cell wall metabolism sensor histidine kinase WalK [candidate division Zixibacteria bacterium]
MPHRRLLWQLYPSYVIISLLAVVALAWYSIRSQRDFYLDQTAIDLETRAMLISTQLVDLLAAGDTTGVDRLCKDLGQVSATRITAILASGKVIGDTQENPDVMGNHGARPEIIQALAGQTGSSIRLSNTMQRNMMYVALPLTNQGVIIGVIRTSVPLTSVYQALDSFRTRMALAGLVIAVVAALGSLLVSRRLSRPIEELKKGAERFAGGDFDRKLMVPRSEEMARLAEAMNQMAGQLDQRISTITRERNEREAILTSMAEGVLAVDTDERILSLNRAAADFFAVAPDRVTGKTIQETVKNAALHKLISTVLRTKNPAEAEIVLTDRGQRILKASGATLRNAEGEASGAVIVLNDVTRLHKLENLRRDFVANVSHELKTPVTSIKGFVETLLDGAANDPDDRNRFLDIIARHSDRLNAIIDDLLSLSRIENAPEPLFEDRRLKDILAAGVQTHSRRAETKNISLKVTCSDDIHTSLNAPLLEQAVGNLIDNAVKYSPSGSEVLISAQQAHNEIIINVRDRGSGIEKRHLPHIFERFYRVDKARSAEMGGTGLGLAITKHIVLAHGGQIDVESTLGTGSTFTIRLPVR